LLDLLILGSHGMSLHCSEMDGFAKSNMTHMSFFFNHFLHIKVYNTDVLPCLCVLLLSKANYEACYARIITNNMLCACYLKEGKNSGHVIRILYLPRPLPIPRPHQSSI
jgi:general stress protein CsbA